MEISNVGIETWGGGSRKQKAKPSKLTLVALIGEITKTKSLDITNLSIKELESVLSVAKTQSTLTEEMPVSRLKKPYIILLEKILPNIQLSKLSVSSLKELIGAFNAK